MSGVILPKQSSTSTHLFWKCRDFAQNEVIYSLIFFQVNEVLTEVSVIKNRQEDLDGKLELMKNENEALWREVIFNCIACLMHGSILPKKYF